MATRYARDIKPTDPRKERDSAGGTRIPDRFERFEQGQAFTIWSEINRISNHDYPEHNNPYWDPIQGNIKFRA